MNAAGRRRKRMELPAFSLVEAVVSLGVLAMIVPVGFAGFAAAARQACTARAEARACRIVPRCLEALSSLRREPCSGEPRTVWWFASGRMGEAIREVEEKAYREGVAAGSGDPAVYLVRVERTPRKGGDDRPMHDVRVVVEYPAVAGEARRTRLEFNTRMP